MYVQYVHMYVRKLNVSIKKNILNNENYLIPSGLLKFVVRIKITINQKTTK